MLSNCTCEKDVGMGLCQYVDLCFHASSLPCLHTFWHAIPTSFYIFNVFLFSCRYIVVSQARSTSARELQLSYNILHADTPGVYSYTFAQQGGVGVGS